MLEKNNPRQKISSILHITLWIILFGSFICIPIYLKVTGNIDSSTQQSLFDFNDSSLEKENSTEKSKDLNVINFENTEISNPEYLQNPNDFLVDNNATRILIQPDSNNTYASLDSFKIVSMETAPINVNAWVEKDISINRFIISYKKEINGQKVLLIKEIELSSVRPYSSDLGDDSGFRTTKELKDCRWSIQKDFPKNLILHKYIFIKNRDQIKVDGQDLLTLMTKNGLGILNTKTTYISPYVEPGHIKPGMKNEAVYQGTSNELNQLDKNIYIAKLAKKGIWGCSGK